jgi:hypothetical protein
MDSEVDITSVWIRVVGDFSPAYIFTEVLPFARSSPKETWQTPKLIGLLVKKCFE